MNKKIYRYSEIIPQIHRAVDTITDPIKQTMSPKGGNVIYEDDQGNQNVTNDGVTIAKNISVKDEVENAIIEIIKGSSLKTNLEAGDGTSSTILMSSILIKEGLRLVENGHNQMDVRDKLNKFALDMRKEISKQVRKVENDEDIKLIAKISANNDESIAEDVVKTIKVVKEDGQVIIDRGFDTKTEIIEDAGFVVRAGLFTQELGNKQMQSGMKDVPVLVTDKRLYYKSEAETILNAVLNAGYSEVVIVAQDFLGEALNYFVANHVNDRVRVILIAEKKPEVLEDIAIYIDTEVISDKKGSLVDKVTIEDFALSPRVFADAVKAIITRDKKEENPGLEKRVRSLKLEMNKIGNKNDPAYTNLQRRISSLTTGMVTLRVGGATNLEVLERIYRYEDAINAARAALKEGYLPGSGVTVLRAFQLIEKKITSDFKRMFRAAAEANVRQIAINCGKNPDSMIEQYKLAKDGFGYNAVSDKMENMIEAGIIEPYLVTTQVIANAVSIANIIITSRYLIVNDLSDENNK